MEDHSQKLGQLSYVLRKRNLDKYKLELNQAKGVYLKKNTHLEGDCLLTRQPQLPKWLPQEDIGHVAFFITWKDRLLSPGFDIRSSR